MSDLKADLAALRDAMAKFPPLEAHTPRLEIDLTDIYFPKSHAFALDPDRSLVIGNRGTGKSFWASALVKVESRQRINDALPEARLSHNIEVQFGFAEGEGSVGISRDELAVFVGQNYPVEQIWRAVVLPHIAKYAGPTVADKLKDRLAWVAREPGEVREIMRAADARLSEKRGKLVFVFDQLEQLSNDLDQRAELTKGILQLALAFKSYRGLRVKIFMRPDHFAEDRLFAFADASKIRGEAVHLDWRYLDLYGLLYSRLLREAPQQFLAICRNADVKIGESDELPSELREAEEDQHRLFDVIAGKVMRSHKRGRPYTWLVSHLADARNLVSPRTFLLALKYAAENPSPPSDTAIDYLGIHEGVRKASENRINDLKEDYPWVESALKELEGLLVPCLPEEMIAKWRDAEGFMSQLRDNVQQPKQPTWLVEFDENREPPYPALLNAMADIGVVEKRVTTGKVDVPDIFRLNAGIKRKGGITQQQRRKARVAND